MNNIQVQCIRDIDDFIEGSYYDLTKFDGSVVEVENINVCIVSMDAHFRISMSSLTEWFALVDKLEDERNAG